MSTIISYCDNDHSFAQRIANDLQVAGFTVFLQDQVAEWESADQLILLISAQAIAQNTWQRPFEAFATQGKLICSARLDATELPSQLDMLDWVDFQLGYQVGINGLRVALNLQPKTITTDNMPVVKIETLKQRILMSAILAIVLLLVGIILILYVF